jgi:hypothetical protein
LQANIDVHHALNGSAVYSVNNTYGRNWLRLVTELSSGTCLVFAREFSPFKAAHAINNQRL